MSSLHTLALDGVFAEHPDGELGFHALPALTNGDVAEVLQIACARILRLLRRKGVIETELRSRRLNAFGSLAASWCRAAAAGPTAEDFLRPFCSAGKPRYGALPT